MAYHEISIPWLEIRYRGRVRAVAREQIRFDLGGKPVVIRAIPKRPAGDSLADALVIVYADRSIRVRREEIPLP